MRRILVLLTSFIMILSTVLFNGAFVFGNEVLVKNQEQAGILKNLGLFRGSERGFELDRAPTRLEGAVMLVRLLGEEEKALKDQYFHPFKDVPLWASPYVGYMYQNNLTQGVSESKFGSEVTMNTLQYTTFILRALGYDDGIGDFQWSKSVEKAKEINLITSEEANHLKEKTTFLRDDVVRLSYNALFTLSKGMNKTLLDKLVDNGAVTIEPGDLEFKQGTEENIWEANVSSKNENSVSLGNENKNNKSDGTVINSGIASLRGDWIYFSTYDLNGHIYKSKLDGTYLTNITTDSFNWITSINLIGKNIIFTANSKKSSGVSLYLLDEETGRVQELDNSLYIHKAVASGEAVYYVKAEGSNSSTVLYKIDINTLERNIVTDKRPQAFTVKDDWVYFDGNYEVIVDGKKRTIANALLKINTDGTDLTLLDGTQGHNGDIKIIGEYVYFKRTSWEEIDGDKYRSASIYRIKDNGEALTTLIKLQHQRNRFYVDKGYIYIIDPEVELSELNSSRVYDDYIYRVNMDGTGKVLISDDKAKFLSVINDQLYYVGTFRSSSIVNLKNGNELTFDYTKGIWKSK